MKKLLITIAAISTLAFTGTALAQSQSQIGGHTWTSLAVAMGNNHATMALARRNTKSEAIQAAITSCEKDNQTGAPCTAQTTFSRGCVYATTSLNGTIPLGWAAGATIEKMYRKCNELNMTCDTNYISMCNY